MGRHISGVAIGGRRQRIVLKASRTGIPIPSWARGGKGVLCVTGVGGGGAGGGAGGPSVLGYAAGAGGSGGAAIRCPLVIPPDATSIDATIGAGGMGATHSSGVGAPGGATTIDIDGVRHLTLGGGGGGRAASVDAPGGMGGGVGVMSAVLATPGTSSREPLGALFAGSSASNSGNNQTGYHNQGGGMSPFGSGGENGAPGPTGSAGGDAMGHGAGGGGARMASETATPQKGGDGSHGLLIFDFEEIA